ncbi:BON domain-containing protein [Dyella sp.]|jgi:hyperosmotically inducible protein|uniref:BON domain-containing protein n=1 Tax=Dyella sp. TaxID=1869338 RepID=UPI002D786995|nr:BON domain-containing protein [Dyella sp.]HET6433269.1 BON domain-containing protein [Dyella sp.]
MNTKNIRKNVIAMALVAAFAAAPLAQAQETAAQNASDAAGSVAQATSDTWITTKVKSEFATADGVDATDISVDTKNGVVMLSGTAASAAEVMKAKKLAMSVEGVKSVSTAGLTTTGRTDDGHDMDNDVGNDVGHAAHSVAQATSDTWITTKVKSTFAAADGVDATDISVDTKNGVVTLSGTAASAAEVMKAKKLARSIEGVKSVNTAGLTTTGRMEDDHDMGNSVGHAANSVAQATSDTWITTKVKSEFATTKGVDFTDISVDTKNGVVTLTGHVASAAEIAKAKQVAMSVKGAKSVSTNGLVVTTSGE